jgi:hypothetical protein
MMHFSILLVSIIGQSMLRIFSRLVVNSVRLALVDNICNTYSTYKLPKRKHALDVTRYIKYQFGMTTSHQSIGSSRCDASLLTPVIVTSASLSYESDY